MTDKNEDVLTRNKVQVEDFLTDTETARLNSERDRDYYDHKQLTAEEEAELKKRKQSPTVTNLDSSMIGESAFQELQALDEEARDELSREARNFLTMLQTYIDQYGRDRAIRLLSGEYTSLSDADKRAIEKALTQR